MKKFLFIPFFLFTLFMMMSCCTEKKDDFSYHVDEFYDTEVLRYRVEGFENLSLQQKKLVYYLSQAAVCGRDILYDQNGKYNLRIRRTLEALYLDQRANSEKKSMPEFTLLEKYLKRVWFANGIHHHYASDKFLPEFSQEWFEKALDDANIAYDRAILPIMFNPELMSKKVCQTAGMDIVVNSAGNYYQNVTQKEAQDYYQKHQDKSDEPLWIGLNSQLVKNEGKIEERVYRIGGLYGQALEQVNFWLKKAFSVAENDQQKKVISKLMEVNQTGDLQAFNEYCIAWVKELDAKVDFVNGFTETYADPLGVTGTWESMVNFKDEVATRRTQLISDNAQWFEDHSPTDKKFKKEEVKGVSAKVITAAMLAGDCYPATPIGINLPNATWIRKEYGSKSVTIDNLMHAYNEASKGDGLNDEFVVDVATKMLLDKYGALCNDLHTDLHECVGHGSGKLNPGVGKDALREYGSTIEETRADLFGLYFLADKKLVDLKLLPNAEAFKAGYYKQMMNGLMTQLVRIEPGKDLEEAHMRNRQLIANWVYQHAQKKEVEIIEKGGKHYLQINDYYGLQRLFGELLKEIQRITSEGDYQTAKTMVETYAIKINRPLHDEILARYKKLNIAPYKGFVNPVYCPVEDEKGEISDVKIDYSEDFVMQNLRYSQNYSFLPDVN